MAKNTLREMTIFNRWANSLLLDAAASMPDAQIDRRFEMGCGTIRETFRHIYGAARIWHERVNGLDQASLLPPANLKGMADLRAALDAHSDASLRWIDMLSNDDLAKGVDFRDREGRPHTRRLSDILLHVCNHGVYHRAQIVNMMRHCGIGPLKPGPDYIFMKWNQPGDGAVPLEVSLIRRYYAYGDYSMRSMLDAAEALSPEKLDHPFDMGLGTLRKTLAHLRDAEWWWEQNWTKGPGTPFPKADESASIQAIRSTFDEIAAARDAMLGSLGDADLNRIIEVAPRPDLKLAFTLGVAMLQICGHGTHHRAQANNMLRHLGATPLKLDYVLWCGDR